ncbi:uncharacterized protein LOC109806876 [Cajanus cajan]|uniref:uncharacterized protein LOC109806876 n=1 Tax=Cajanus cajan TaxID=3821 RepID=UPI00098D7CE9|nr:uncharacterized protein LOC109806876 [Cajanus cajan]
MSIKYRNSLDIFLAENPKIGENRMLGQLRILTLYKVRELQSIKSRESSWLNTISEKLQELNVFECPDLSALVHSTATISFSCLKRVSISNCPQLQYLFTSFMAKKLMNLEEITIKECESVKEIVAKQGDSTSEAIKFERLNTIVVDSLPSLICFYSDSDTLQLPSLIKVHIWQCPNLKYFSQGAIDAKSFLGVQMSLDTSDDLFFHKDLNATIREMFQQHEFFKSVDKECFSDDHELGAYWHGKVVSQSKWLSNVLILKLDKCTLPYAIPSGILPCLKNLRELEVRYSDKVKGIFEVNDIEIMDTASQLKILTLEGLSELTHVWEKNSPGVPIFQNLQQIVVSDCENLQTLIPASLARNLKELEKLEIEFCDKLQEIVEKEEGIATNVTEKFVFPHLKMLLLYDLPQLTYFCPQTFSLECPALNNLSVLYCNKLELFQRAHSTGEHEGSTSINRLPPTSFLKVISNLKELELDWQQISALSLRFRSGQFAEGLKYLNNFSLFLDTDENEKPILPIEILQKAPNLTEMSIKYSNSLEIFLAKNPKIGESKLLGQLRILTLYEVLGLQSIESQDSSWLNTICEKLQELNVFECPDLTTLVHSTATVSFSCLKKVSISKCSHLQFLFTSLAAKKLMNLEEISVKECESVKEIIAKQGVSTSEAIKFERLNTIVLNSLPSLTDFYSGNDTLQLSSLIKVHLWQCPNLKNFSKGAIDAKSFQGVQKSLDPNDDLFFRQDLNSTIREMFQRQEILKAGYGVYISELHIDVDLQNYVFESLVILKLDKCALQYAIPSSILPFLKNLEELEVQDSDEVEGIFEMNDTEIIETASRLKILTLKGLSELKHVWENNSQGVLIFQNLQQVVVSGCKILQTLFPALLAKNLRELEKLEIESCDKLHEIVEKEEGTRPRNGSRIITI